MRKGQSPGSSGSGIEPDPQKGSTALPGGEGGSMQVSLIVPWFPA